MFNKIDLDGRGAVVTGGAQSIGRAIAQRFLEPNKPPTRVPATRLTTSTPSLGSFTPMLAPWRMGPTRR
jgi:hypothetical protein